MDKLMIDVTDLSPKDLESMLSKGQMEVCARNAGNRFSSFTKCAVSEAPDERCIDVVNTACSVMDFLGAGMNLISEIKRGKQENLRGRMQSMRQDLKQLERERDAANAKLDVMLDNYSVLFDTVEDLKQESKLVYKLSAANLTLAKEANSKLDQIINQLNVIEKKIDQTRLTDYVHRIKQPSETILLQYQRMIFSLKQGKPVSEDMMLDNIISCRRTLGEIYDMRNVIGMDTALGLLLELLPVYTDMIVQYYMHYYDPRLKKHDSHNSWLKIFKQLDSKEFVDDLEFHLFTQEHMCNREVKGIKDYLYLRNHSCQKRIEESLSDLEMCGSADAYQDALAASTAVEEKLIADFKKELSAKIEPEKAQEMTEKAQIESENFMTLLGCNRNYDISRLMVLQSKHTGGNVENDTPDSALNNNEAAVQTAE